MIENGQRWTACRFRSLTRSSALPLTSYLSDTDDTGEEVDASMPSVQILENSNQRLSPLNSTATRLATKRWMTT